MRKLSLLSKFMTSKTGPKTIRIHILSNISRSKGNQVMEFGQLIKYNERNFLFKNHGENKAGIPVLDLFLLFNKALYKIKVSDQHLSFNMFWQTSTWTYNKNKFLTFQAVDPEICAILVFLEKGLGLASPPHFVNDYSRKIFPMLYTIK